MHYVIALLIGAFTVRAMLSSNYCSTAMSILCQVNCPRFISVQLECIFKQSPWVEHIEQAPDAPCHVIWFPCSHNIDVALGKVPQILCNVTSGKTVWVLGLSVKHVHEHIGITFVSTSENIILEFKLFGCTTACRQ